MAPLGFSLQIQRDIARSFSVTTIGDDAAPAFIGGAYDGRASIDVGEVSFDITALDLDLLIRENEPLDKAGVRVLRRAFSDNVPEFPALLVASPTRAVISFWPDQPLVVGRARSSAVRLDAPTVSLQHARIGFESGEFWVEDLGSTNGTFVGDKQVSSRISVPAGAPIRISKHASLVGVTSRKQLQEYEAPKRAGQAASVTADALFPSLVSMAEVARPSRLVLKPGARVEIGRDPSCGLWLGAPHVSRKHCIVGRSKSGVVSITDSSTNGTAFDGGLLHSQESYQTADRPLVLDFGAGVTVAVCFNGEQEQVFQQAHGAPFAFKDSGASGTEGTTVKRSRIQRERRTTTWFNMDADKLQELGVEVGLVGRAHAMISGLTVPGRVAIGAIAVGFCGLLVLMGSMLVSGAGW
jgi:pSer/pThr/pTyr-binding forkhead associated (FHA) protein